MARWHLCKHSADSTCRHKKPQLQRANLLLQLLAINLGDRCCLLWVWSDSARTQPKRAHQHQMLHSKGLASGCCMQLAWLWHPCKAFSYQAFLTCLSQAQCVLQESHAQRRQLACMTSQAKDDAAQRQVKLRHRCVHCAAQGSCCHVVSLRVVHRVQSSTYVTAVVPASGQCCHTALVWIA